MSIMYKPTEPLEVGIGESMPAEFIKEAERSRARIVSLTDEIKRLKAENAKLRELVCWMYDRMDESCAVQYPYAPAPISYDRLMQALARARELGVEVNE